MGMRHLVSDRCGGADGPAQGFETSKCERRHLEQRRDGLERTLCPLSAIVKSTY
jgi:hypothetical protein